MSDESRPKLKLKAGVAAERDPRRPRVRSTTKRPQQTLQQRQEAQARREEAERQAADRRGAKAPAGQRAAKPRDDTRAPAAQPRDDTRGPAAKRPGDRPPPRGRDAERPPAPARDARRQAGGAAEFDLAHPPRGGRPGRPERPERARPTGRPPRPEPHGSDRRGPRDDRPLPRPRPLPDARGEGRDRPSEAAKAPAPPRQAPEDAGVRLSKVMSDRGLASRREADEWIEAGWVRVDGEVASLGRRVRPDQHIEIDPRARTHQAQSVTILLHKPVGYVSGQAEDDHEPARVLVTPENHWSGDTSRIEFHRGHLRSLVPAGRLDIDSTGLLVLTQDGRVARHLIGEDSLVEKEYLVRVEPVAEGSVREDALPLLNHGLELDGQPLKPAKVSWQNEDQLRFVLREGRKRQIRRMCELVGLRVTGLKRVRIGSVVLGKLPVGQWRYLASGEKF